MVGGTVDFNPRSPCGERRNDRASLRQMLTFQSTLPVWGATSVVSKLDGITQDFNPRSPCGERRSSDFLRAVSGRFQSTLPVWGATGKVNIPAIPFIISIHAPRVGSDFCSIWVIFSKHKFQSTLPVWGATELQQRYPALLLFQSTLPVWGATGRSPCGGRCAADFNPRSPCGERQPPIGSVRITEVFQSTLPVWGATCIF